MAGRFETLYLEAQRRVSNYERVADRAADQNILRCALRVINRHNLAGEFVDELTAPPIQPE